VWAALPLAAAFAYLLIDPWHGAVVLALSEQHGIDVADLPAVLLIGVSVAIAETRARNRDAPRRRRVGIGVGAACAVVLGALLVAGVLDPKVGSPLVPAGGGTFGGGTAHADGVASEPPGRWSHLALTYDGTRLRMYVDGRRVSSLAATGSILRTSHPLWIGGNRPYGEYFHGTIDEVRVYDRALSPSSVAAEMSVPVGGGGDGRELGLVAAYGFDRGSGRTVEDDSGDGNTAGVQGATWTRAGRYGRGMRFEGVGEIVRVPASVSLDLRRAMTLSAWVRPSESQSGWRTVLARQTDAYFLMAGGGRELAGRLRTLDDVRFALLIALALLVCAALASGRARWMRDRPAWYLAAVALFVAGSVVDALLSPSDTLVGLVLVAAWCGASAKERDERLAMYVLAGGFGAVTLVAIAAPGALPFPHDDGGVVRAAALGLLLITGGVLSARRSVGARRTRALLPR
jgi:concanavalin A-like lectin/glucanase superfamily protein